MPRVMRMRLQPLPNHHPTRQVRMIRRMPRQMSQRTHHQQRRRDGQQGIAYPTHQNHPDSDNRACRGDPAKT